MSQITLLIPAYRPSRVVFDIVQEILHLDKHHYLNAIIVVDDGSGKMYQGIFSHLKLLNKVEVIHHAINLGKGAALKSGFNHILLNFPKTASIVTADADGQHLAHDIMKIVQHSLVQSHKLVLGVRTFSHDIPLRSLVGNQVTRLVMRFFTGLNLADTQTGLRAWPPALALQALTITTNGYDFEMALLVRAKDLSGTSLEIEQVPISTVYEEGNKSSHFNPLLDSMRIYFVFIRYCAAGLLTALTDNIIFITVYAFSGSVLQSQLVSRSSGALVSFILGFHIVFKSNTHKLLALAKFISLVILFGFVSYGLIQFLTHFGAFPLLLQKFQQNLSYLLHHLPFSAILFLNNIQNSVKNKNISRSHVGVCTHCSCSDD